MDQAGLLSPAARAELAALGQQVAARDGAELAVATVRTTDGVPPRDWARRLFNHWELGDRQRNNGVLLFVASEDRAAEIILGDGIDDAAQVALADRIMQGAIVPRFRAGQPEAGLLAGSRALAAQLFGVTPESAPGAARRIAPEGAPLPAVEAPLPAPESSDVVVAPIPGEARSRRGTAGTVVAAILGAGVAMVGGGVALLGFLRRRPRPCRACSRPMDRLGEAEDDRHLEPAQLTEERLGSVNYDVWLCAGCGVVEVTRHAAWFSRYAACPSCGAKTKSEVSHTLRAATYSSGGLVQVDESCAQCSFRRSRQRTTPQLTRSSSGSSGGGSRSGGGGRSSGGGSSGRW